MRGLGHNEIDYKLLKLQSRNIYAIEIECILNGVPWQRFALSGRTSRFI